MQLFEKIPIRLTNQSFTLSSSYDVALFDRVPVEQARA